MFSFLNDVGNYEERKVARDTAESGIVVSTAYTSDEGYETALIDCRGTYPVERYRSKEEAQAGHIKWLEFAQDANGKTMICLGGLKGLVGDENVVLCGTNP